MEIKIESVEPRGRHGDMSQAFVTFSAAAGDGLTCREITIVSGAPDPSRKFGYHPITEEDIRRDVLRAARKRFASLRAAHEMHKFQGLAFSAPEVP